MTQKGEDMATGQISLSTVSKSLIVRDAVTDDTGWRRYGNEANKPLYDLPLPKQSVKLQLMSQEGGDMAVKKLSLSTVF